jgi:hypothetical protein
MDLKNFSVPTDYVKEGTVMCGRCSWAKIVCRCIASEHEATLAPNPAGYVVIENTPGYLPDSDDPGRFDTYEEAIAHANDLAAELEANDYVCDRPAAGEIGYVISCTTVHKMHDLGRVIEVIEEESDGVYFRKQSSKAKAIVEIALDQTADHRSANEYPTEQD